MGRGQIESDMVLVLLRLLALMMLSGISICSTVAVLSCKVLTVIHKLRNLSASFLSKIIKS